MNYINPHEFYLETNEKIIDVDGFYGGQCWDLFTYFTKKYCNKTFSCLYTGYVIDLYKGFNELGLSMYFDLITDYSKLIDGDWIIWDKQASVNCWITSKSHIAMFRKYNESNLGQCIILTQNPNGNPKYVHQMLCDFHGFVGALRPKVNYLTVENKINIVKPVERNKKIDQLYISCPDTMRVRKNYSLSSEILGFAVVGFYDILDIVENNNYKWIKVFDNQYIALVENYSYIVKKEELNTDNTSTLDTPETTKNSYENNEIEDNNTDIYLTEKQKYKFNFIASIIISIIKFFKKYYKKY